MSQTLNQFLDQIPFEAQLQVLLSMLNDLTTGKDATLGALNVEATRLGTRMVIVGGVAVIRNGYRRTTTDRDVLVDYRGVHELADALMDHPDWERLEIRQYAFIHKPTSMSVDFLVSRDLITLGRPYYFPDVDAVETLAPLEGIPVLGINDLVWFKLLAGRMRDLADIMELCKLNPGKIDPDRVLAALEKEDDDLRATLLEIIRRAPLEIEAERRLGQGEVLRKIYDEKRRSGGANPN